MKIFLLCLFIIAQPSWSDVKESDIQNPNGSAKVLWKDMNEEQKAFVLERQRAAAEYTIANQGKRFIELKDIPKTARTFEAVNSKKVYFSTDAVVLAYEKLGDFDAAIKLAKADYEANPDRSHGPFKLEYLIGLLSSAGRHKEALELYPKYLKELLPSYSEQDFATKKSMPNNPTYNDAMKFGEELKKRAANPSTQADEPETSIKMHRAFHSKDRRARLEAVEFYSQRRVRFMLEKASNSDDPEVKQRARDRIKAFEGK